MSCERYQKALVEAAARSDSLPLDLRRHLNTCSPCRAAFEQEQSLFSSIDARIRETANGEVPPSLLARVRIRLAQEPSPSKKRSSTAKWLYAAAATLLLALLPLLRMKNASIEPAKREAEAKDALVTMSQGFNAERDHSAHRASSTAKRENHIRRSVTSRVVRKANVATNTQTLEVLVPANQELLLRRYARALYRRSAPTLSVGPYQIPSVGRSPDSLDIAELQFQQLPDLASE